MQLHNDKKFKVVMNAYYTEEKIVTENEVEEEVKKFKKKFENNSKISFYWYKDKLIQEKK